MVMDLLKFPSRLFTRHQNASEEEVTLEAIQNAIQQENQGRVNLSSQNRLESWATWHRDMEINQEQALKLVENLKEKREELITESIIAHVGSYPGEKTVRKRVRIVNVDPDPYGPNPTAPTLSYVFYGATLIAYYTSPSSRLQGNRYILSWHFQNLAA